MKAATKAYLGCVAFSIAGTAVSQTVGVDPGPIRPIASAATLVAGVAALLAPTCERMGLGRALLGFLAVLALGAAAEIAGLYTGLPFGRYEYTDRWQPTVLLPGDRRFPLLLPMAWFLVAGASYLWVARRLHGIAAAAAGALVATLVDAAMEPVLTGPLGYWNWLEPKLLGIAPPANFAGWFGVSLLAGLILESAGYGRSADRTDSAWVLGGHLGLMAAIAALAS
ncbi:MAG: carotenoid biosynthesis protein [Fimbriimonadaceae bacterium]